VPDVGRIFPAKPGRGYLRAAAAAAGLPKATVAALTPYSLRHARTVNLLEASGNLLGVGFLVGHKHVSTTDRYLRSRHRHAVDVLAKATQRVSGKSPETLPKKGKK
jgi:site-specific recombinase XerC